MASNGLISVVVPAHNSGKYLRNLIANLERQTYKNFELIVVSGRSTDNTAELLKEFGKSRKWINFICPDNDDGPGFARNIGVQASSGEFIMFIDVDDSFSDSYLEKMRYVIERDRADIGFCSSIIRKVFGTVYLNIFTHAEPNHYELFSGQEAFHNFFNLFDNRLLFLSTPWSKIIRKSFYERTNLEFIGKISEDFIMTFKELALADRVACYNDYLYSWNVSDLKLMFSRIKRLQREQSSMHNVPQLISESVLSCGLHKDASSAALRFYFFYFRYEYQQNILNPHFIEGFDSMVDEYHRNHPPFKYNGNEYYVFFELLLLYLNSVRFGHPEHFARFIRPFRQTLKGWISNSNVGFNSAQEAILEFFIEFSAEARRSFWLSRAVRKYFPRLAKFALSMMLSLNNGYLRMQVEKFLLNRSGWFDENFFVNDNADVKDFGSSPLQYFIEKGWKEGRNPNGWFDISRFFKSFPEVKARNMNPILFFYFNGLNTKRFF
jgi:glycosyltransferase involved in cell wall biosynthesis